MPLFLINQDDFLNETRVEISPSDSYHIIRSLRKRKGDLIKISDGQFIYQAKIVDDSRIVKVDIISKREIRPSGDIHLTLCVSMVKFKAWESILKSSTALGVRQIYPLCSKNSQRWPVSDSRKKRWDTIIRESAIQSENPCPPVMNDSIEFQKALTHFKDHFNLMFHPYADGTLKEALAGNQEKDIVIYIGSESGFSDEEVQDSIRHGVRVVKLETNILKTELASLVALGNILFYYTK
ncbi:MAG: 16S rRNA (uracil(1498)-N(3))-methyltransferase [Spirochaetes bacterium]|nr:16S rRNA (uracil(1498)-N(3))-methyltransferase [Spirochaetota bacterium]